MPPPSWHRTRRKTPVGLGRNCTLFETARTWAYSEVRHHWGDPDGLATAIEATAHTFNSQFTEPLPHNEVHHLAASIHRWITTRSRIWADGPTVYEATFTTIQSTRGRKGGKAKGEHSARKITEALA